MLDLLIEANRRHITPAFTARLIALMQGAQTRPDGERPASDFLIEPLSRRELEILQLVAEGLSNQDIGERLYLALDTVKGHNRRIFEKLQVQRRTEAVARARALKLL
jgi:LuxR family maltose regulon positive regulatory protein